MCSVQKVIEPSKDPTVTPSPMVQQNMPMESLSTPLLQREAGPARESKLKKRGSEARMATMFPDLKQIKTLVGKALRHHVYDVEDYYWESGTSQAIARHDHFKDFMQLVILMNMVWIAVETDLNNADVLCNAAPMFQISDNAFCVIFLFEILIRFMSFKHKVHALLDTWFIFDSTLVLLMIWETWIVVILYSFFGFAAGQDGARSSQLLRGLRLARLVRIARAARFLHSVPELWVLGRGMIQGLRAVVAVLVLLTIVIYLFAIIFRITLSGTEVGAGIFDSVPQSMNFLMIRYLWP